MKIHTNCLICGADVYTYPKDHSTGRGKYCSRACNLEGRSRGMVTKSGKENPMYGRKRPKSEIENQKAAIAKNGHFRKGKHLSEEHKRRIGASNTGKCAKEKHPKWKGGITYQNSKQRCSWPYRQWKKQVFERDDYTCVRCGSRERVVPHHILDWAHYIEERFAVDNGICVCHICHMDLHNWTAALVGGTLHELRG